LPARLLPTSSSFAWLVMVSRRTYSNPRLRRFRPLTPLSRCGCPAPDPCPARGPPPALRDRYRCRCDRFASGGDVSDVTVRRGSCDPDVFHRVDLAALARVAPAIVLTIPAALGVRLRSSPGWWAWRLDRVPRDRTGAASPRRHSCGEPGELGRLPSRGAQHVGWDYRHTWVRTGGDPGPFDRCLQLTDAVFKDDRPKSRRTPHRILPTRWGAVGSRRTGSLR
jgi:hypothetical protein